MFLKLFNPLFFIHYMIDKDKLIKINIEGDYSRNLDFVINTLSAIRDITYDIAKESIKSPQNEPVKLTKDIKSDYSLEIEEIRLNSFHASLRLKDLASETVLPKMSELLSQLQNENTEKLEKLEISQETKNNILKKIKEMVPKRMFLENPLKVSMELANGNSLESFNPNESLPKFIDNFIKLHPSNLVEEEKLVGRLIGVQIADSKRILIDSVKGKLTLKVPKNSESTLIDFIEKYLGKIVELEGVLNIKGKSAIISNLDNLKIIDTDLLFLKSFLGDNHLFKLKEPIPINLKYITDEELFILKNEDLNVYASSYNLFKAYKNFREAIGDLFYLYTIKYSDDELNKGGIKLRQKLMTMLSS